MAHRISAGPRTGALGTAVLAAMLLHALLLTGWRDGGAAGSPQPPGHPAPPLQVRWLDGSSGSHPPPPASPGAAAPEDAAARQAAPREPAPAQGTPATPAPSPTSNNPPAIAALPLDGVEHSGEGGADEYLPRRLLSRAPQPGRPVLLDYPDSAPPGRWTVVLTLFIDESGRVRRVRARHDGDLPPELLEAATQAFLSTRYQPGERAGQAVKSRIPVEVTFDAGQEPRSAGVP